MPTRPIVAIPTRRHLRKTRYVDYVAEAHLELLLRLGLQPLMIPVVEGTLSALPQFREGIAGLLLVEGEDIEPKRYTAEPANRRYLEATHPLKDEIELCLLRYALRKRLPVMGICRGSQLMNIACGGTLYGDVQKELHSHLKHIHPGPRYDAYRHPVTIVPETPLARCYRAPQIEVNSYHHQGVRTLASRFRPMAHAPDGLVEAFYDPKAPFLIGLQFHPERMLNEHPGNLRIWKAFAEALRRVGR